MGNRAIITKDQVLDAAYDIAMTKGLGALGIRSVAEACGVAVGTIYRSYPGKSDLVNDVVARFWLEAFSDSMHADEEGDEGFIAYCQRLSQEMVHALERFRSSLLAELTTLDAQDLAAAHQRERQSFDHAKQGLRKALEHDPMVRRDRLVGPLAPEPLCDFVWESLLDTARLASNKDPRSSTEESENVLDETLLALLGALLYH